MVVSCCAFNCTNRFKRGNGITFYKFPLANRDLTKVWIHAIRRENFTAANHHAVCSVHFAPECFLEGYVNQRKLTAGAVPSVFDFPDRLKSKVVSSRSSTSIQKLDDMKKTEQVQPSDEVVNESEPPSVSEIFTEHAYSVVNSPSKLKRKYDAIIERKTDQLSEQRKKAATACAKVKRKEKKLSSMKELLEELKNQSLLSKEASTIMDERFTDVSKEIFLRLKSDCKSGEYNNTLKSFALTLYFYSPAAYEFVRSSLGLCLPHKNTIRRWYSSVDGKPGFTSESFEAIKSRVKACKHEIYCCVTFDEMAIRKRVDWDGREFVGYVDKGEGVCNDDPCSEAKEALVIMVVGLNVSWKIPIAYFLIDGINASEKANLITESLRRLHEAGVTAKSITFDGLKSNLNMANLLGAKMEVEGLKSSIPHPITKDNVWIMPDACHMIKLLRTLFSDKISLLNYKSEFVSWEFISLLHAQQEKEGLRLANKLTKNHINFHTQKMKVKLAVQVFSSSVANALLFAAEDMKEGGNEKFKHSGPTAEFCSLIDRLFDLLNSKNILAKGFKAPMKDTNKIYWEPLLANAEQYLIGLSDAFGVPIYRGVRKTPILGLLALIQSVRGLYKDLVESGKLKYLLTYKFSQDHIELFFCRVRGRFGWNNNPSAVQFRSAYRQLLVRNEVKTKTTGNCVPQDNTPLLSWEPNFLGRQLQEPIEMDESLFSSSRRCDGEIQSEDVTDEEIPDLPCPTALSEFSRNIVVYVAGFVVKSVAKKIECSVCITALFLGQSVSNSQQPQNYEFLLRKNNGGLCVPSESVVTICEATEKFIRQMMTENCGKPPRGKRSLLTLQYQVLKYLSHRDLFPQLSEHSLDNEFPDNHIISLQKIIVHKFVTIRCHHIANVHTSSLHKKVLRQHLTKSVHFYNQ